MQCVSPQQQRVLQQWLRSVELPEHLWPRLFAKLDGDVFDVGASFALAQRAVPADSPDPRAVGEEEEEGEGPWDNALQDTEHEPEPDSTGVASAAPVATIAELPVPLSDRDRRQAERVENDDDEEDAGAAAGTHSRARTPQRAGAGGDALGADLTLHEGASALGGGGGGGGDPPPVDDQNEEKLAPGYALLSTRDLRACEDVWLVDHCFTFPLHEDVRPTLQSNPELVSRLEALMRMAPYDEAGDTTAENENEEDASRANEEGDGTAGARLDNLDLDNTENVDDGATLSPEARRARNAAQRIYESMWPHIGFYHMRQHSVPADAVMRRLPTDASQRAREESTVDGGADAASDSDTEDGTHDEVRTTCCGFFHDEVGSSISRTTNENEVNVKLLPIPIFFPEKGCMLSVMWNVKEMPAGMEAKRRPVHRWESACGVEVTDVLYGRSGPTCEDSLRMCVASWRNKLAMQQANRAMLYSMIAPGSAGQLNDDCEGNSQDVMARAAAAAQALVNRTGPLSLYTDSQNLIRLAMRFPPLSGALQRAAVPSEATALWRIHRTPRSLRDLGPCARFAMWLPGEHTFLDYPQLLRLLHVKVGSRPWCPVVYDGTRQLKEFIGDFLIRELAMNWELGSLQRASEVAGLSEAAAANVLYDVFAEQKRLLRQQDGTNLWIVQRVREPGDHRPGGQLASSPSRSAFDAEDTDYFHGDTTAPQFGITSSSAATTPEDIQSLLFGAQASHEATGGRGAGGATEELQSTASPSASARMNGTPVGGDFSDGVIGALDHTIVVTANLDEVLKVSEAYPTYIRKLCVSPALGARKLSARSDAFLAAGGTSATLHEKDTPFFFQRHGDQSPVFQLLVLVQYDPTHRSTSSANDHESSSPTGTRSRSCLRVYVHHLVPVRSVTATPLAARVVGAGGALCLCGPMTSHPLNPPVTTGSLQASPNISAASTAAPGLPPPLPVYLQEIVLDAHPTAHRLRVSNMHGDARERRTEDDVIARCHTLVRELFFAVGQDYERRITPALLATMQEAPCPVETYAGVYGVNVQVAFTPMVGPQAPGQGPLTEAQPVLLDVTRHPELPTAAAYHPAIYGEILSALLLDTAVNATRVL